MIARILELFRRDAARAVVSVAIVDGEGLVMVLEGRRPKRGMWNTPGGRVQSNESIIDSAVREAKEECGLDVRLDGLVGVYSLQGGGKPRVLRFCFAATATGGALRADGAEILDVRVRSFDELRRMPDSELLTPLLLRRILHDAERSEPIPLDGLFEAVRR